MKTNGIGIRLLLDVLLYRCHSNCPLLVRVPLLTVPTTMLCS
ncbi:hypothetical protein [Spirosoma arcticum]